MSTIVLSYDHAGYIFRGPIAHYLEAQGYNVLNVGPKKIDEQDDYPDYASIACQMLLSGEAERGILICGTGIGMSMAANRHKRVRAVLAYDVTAARIGRTHNDCNVICFGARTMELSAVLDSLEVFLKTDFLGGKYQRRNDKIDS